MSQQNQINNNYLLTVEDEHTLHLTDIFNKLNISQILNTFNNHSELYSSPIKDNLLNLHKLIFSLQQYPYMAKSDKQQLWSLAGTLEEMLYPIVHHAEHVLDMVHQIQNMLDTKIEHIAFIKDLGK